MTKYYPKSSYNENFHFIICFVFYRFIVCTETCIPVFFHFPIQTIHFFLGSERSELPLFYHPVCLSVLFTKTTERVERFPCGLLHSQKHGPTSVHINFGDPGVTRGGVRSPFQGSNRNFVLKIRFRQF